MCGGSKIAFIHLLLYTVAWTANAQLSVIPACNCGVHAECVPCSSPQEGSCTTRTFTDSSDPARPICVRYNEYSPAAEYVEILGCEEEGAMLSDNPDGQSLVGVCQVNRNPRLHTNQALPGQYRFTCLLPNSSPDANFVDTRVIVYDDENPYTQVDIVIDGSEVQYIDGSHGKVNVTAGSRVVMTIRSVGGCTIVTDFCTELENCQSANACQPYSVTGQEDPVKRGSARRIVFNSVTVNDSREYHVQFNGDSCYHSKNTSIVLNVMPPQEPTVTVATATPTPTPSASSKTDATPSTTDATPSSGAIRPTSTTVPSNTVSDETPIVENNGQGSSGGDSNTTIWIVTLSVVTLAAIVGVGTGIAIYFTRRWKKTSTAKENGEKLDVIIDRMDNNTIDREEGMRREEGEVN